MSNPPSRQECFLEKAHRVYSSLVHSRMAGPASISFLGGLKVTRFRRLSWCWAPRRDRWCVIAAYLFSAPSSLVQGASPSPPVRPPPGGRPQASSHGVGAHAFYLVG